MRLHFSTTNAPPVRQHTAFVAATPEGQRLARQHFCCSSTRPIRRRSAGGFGVAAPKGQRLVRQVMVVSVAALAAYTRTAATLVLGVEVRCF